MIISITNVAFETAVVTYGLLFALMVSVRRAKDNSLFSPNVSNELKGLAILMIVLSHIGYFLVSNNQFLVPLSNFAGVGVDLFLVLSGYGLVVSALRKPLSVGKFYLKRFPRIYLPMIITLAVLLLADFFILGVTYPITTTLQNFLGIFGRANLYEHIDSPLWYITFLLINYLFFPIIFRRRFAFLSALAMTFVIWLTILYLPKINLIGVDLLSFYKLHLFSFPLGMAIATLLNQPPRLITTLAEKLKNSRFRSQILMILRFASFIFAGFILIYTYQHSQIGQIWYRESIASLTAVVGLLIIFILKKVDFRALSLFGVFSFEIYLLHWPLLWRYNFLFGRLPAGSATLIYLALFVGVGYLFKKGINKILNTTGFCNLTK